MSVSISGDCLTSLRDAVARQKEGTSLHSELGEISLGSAGGDSSDTEDCEELEIDRTPGEGREGSQASSPGLDIEPSMMGSPRPASLTSPTSPVHRVVEPAPEIQVTATCPEESFVVIDPGQGDEGVEAVSPGPAMRPGDGYTWSRQLVFRAKLTQHTAYERTDNTEPAPVTALAVSRDHRTLFVGDERGRVFSWVVGTKPGKGFVDHWVKDDTADSC